MNNVSSFKDCFGCGVCVISCPKHIINLQLNANGFYYPMVDSTQCIDCSLCLKSCSYVQNDVSFYVPLGSYSAWSIAPDIRKKTTSGGVVYEISNYFLSLGYKVCAVKYNTSLHRAEHYIAQTPSQLEPSIGSKYIQSYTIPGFSLINKSDKYVVIGTPCQIDSLRRYINRLHIENNFVLIDFFCHGVPSMLLWKSYLKMVGISDIVDVHFRSKKDGWQESTCIEINKRSSNYFSKLTDGDLFYKFFLGNRCLNKPCYDDCKFKTINSSADIRVGDMWGKKYCTNKEGISAVITFTEKGEEIIHSLSNCSIRDESINDVLGIQMRKNAQRPLSYKFVMSSLKKNKHLTFIDYIASLIELPNKSRKKFIYINKRLKQLFVK